MRRCFRSPIGWLLVGVVAIGAISSLMTVGKSGSAAEVVLSLVAAAVAIPIYRAVMLRLARRDAPELAIPGAGREVLLGAAVGAAFVLVSTLLIVALGGYSLTWDPGNIVPVLAVAVGAAVTEELLFRGLALQAVERLGGSRIALAVTALFFGVSHLANEGANLWSAIALTVEAGVLLGAAFLWRRNLWFVIGLHFAWNSMVGILGIPVSGHTSTGLFTVEADGPMALTGGRFGLEASVIPVVVGLVIAIPMLVMAHHRHSLTPSPRRARVDAAWR
jgi:CAAX protease family protein